MVLKSIFPKLGLPDDDGIKGGNQIYPVFSGPQAADNIGISIVIHDAAHRAVGCRIKGGEGVTVYRVQPAKIAVSRVGARGDEHFFQ